ncbi:class I SAM-dependent methyltransferase [Thalassotalea euphylliae]|uniref:class I SAM-dependent methyltransferase n=1 Tax=Thalassotalea euphylliae TaxID=1655234 RepID=UPI00363A0796
MTDYLAINKTAWNTRTDIHFSSTFYDVDGFLNGKSTLHAIELGQVGDVSGKSLLHLQCHFGLDTLSWARLGAKVTGVDLSSTAVEKAQNLAEQTGLDAHFICSDVYHFGTQCQQHYDIVYTSYGVLCWLPSMDNWAETVAKCLKPGGKIHLVEFHPYLDIKFGYDYFHKAQPDIEEESTYSENAGDDKQTIAVWAHPIANVITALIKAGIEIEEVCEYPYSPYACFDGMKAIAENQFVFDEDGPEFPLLYSIKGRKKA